MVKTHKLKKTNSKKKLLGKSKFGTKTRGKSRIHSRVKSKLNKKKMIGGGLTPKLTAEAVEIKKKLEDLSNKYYKIYETNQTPNQHMLYDGINLVLYFVNFLEAIKGLIFLLIHYPDLMHGPITLENLLSFLIHKQRLCKMYFNLEKKNTAFPGTSPILQINIQQPQLLRENIRIISEALNFIEDNQADFFSHITSDSATTQYVLAKEKLDVLLPTNDEIVNPPFNYLTTDYVNKYLKASPNLVELFTQILEQTPQTVATPTPPGPNVNVNAASPSAVKSSSPKATVRIKPPTPSNQSANTPITPQTLVLADAEGQENTDA